MLLVIVGIGHALQVAADDGFRLVVLGRGHGLEALVAVGDVNVAAHVVEQVRALEQQHGHPGVVVALRRDVAIGAVLGFVRAHRVRHVGAERLPAEAFGRNGLLRVVEPVAILILRADQRWRMKSAPARRDGL